MTMQQTYQIILCTSPDKESAEKIARQLINDKIAACVNILPGLTSIFPWQGKIETEQEHLLLIKTRKDRYQFVEKSIQTNHPYEIPEIIAIPVENGLAEYMQWIESCLS